MVNIVNQYPTLFAVITYRTPYKATARRVLILFFSVLTTCCWVLYCCTGILLTQYYSSCDMGLIAAAVNNSTAAGHCSFWQRPVLSRDVGSILTWPRFWPHVIYSEVTSRNLKSCDTIEDADVHGDRNVFWVGFHWDISTSIYLWTKT